MDQLNPIGEFIDKYAVHIGTTNYNKAVFVINALLLIIFWGVRFILYFNMINKSNAEKDEKKSKTLECFGNMSICCVFGFIVSIFFISVSCSMFNYFISCVFSPILGFIISFIFDKKFVSKDFKIKEEKKKEEPKPSTNNQNVVNVNVNVDNDDDHEDKKEKFSLDEIIKQGPDYLSHYDVESEDYNSKLKDSINNLKDIQYTEAVELKNQSNELAMQSQILTAVRDTMMTDKKFKLKRMIYQCLDQGFATPDQNEIIIANYNNYRALGGNSDVKVLYEKQYLKLHVHNDEDGKVKEFVDKEKKTHESKSSNNEIRYFSNMVPEESYMTNSILDGRD